MRIHHFAHVHSAAFCHLACWLDSVRRFEEFGEDSQITVVCWGEEVFNRCLDTFTYGALGCTLGMQFVPMPTVADDCARLGLDWQKWGEGKDERSQAWCMQSCLPYWMLNRGEWTDDYNAFCYWDNDTLWFAPFMPIADTMPETAHVAIAPHRYPPGKENVGAGRFNNGALWFRNSEVSRQHFLRWGQETMERWNPNHLRAVGHEQKLLDEWPEQLGEACVELPPEVNWGAWRRDRVINVGGIPSLPLGQIRIGDEEIAVITKLEGQECKPLQSAHMHEFRRGAGRNPITINGQQWNRSGYDLCPETIESVYLKYEAEISKYA